MKDKLIIFIKNPVLGHAKTRIAEKVGDDRALEIYLNLLQHTQELSLSIPVCRCLYYSNEILEDDWSSEDFNKYVQCDGDLGGRIQDAFTTHLEEGCSTVIIGSDCLELQKEIVEQAFHLLASADLVLGPCSDGGYYLLGINKMYPALFQHVRWSTPDTLNDTLISAEKLGLSILLLPELNDIDTIEDWNKFHGIK